MDRKRAYLYHAEVDNPFYEGPLNANGIIIASSIEEAQEEIINKYPPQTGIKVRPISIEELPRDIIKRIVEEVMPSILADDPTDVGEIG